VDAVPTLARKLGTTEHLSPLLHKARKLGLGPRELQMLAVQRGCIHYSDGTEPLEPLATETAFSNEELTIALLSPCLPYDPHSIRCGAAMASAPGNNAANLARLAIMERCEIPLRYIAECGQHFEPENVFWKELLQVLPPHAAPSDVLPHPTRFVAMTGFTRRGRELLIEWQRPQQGVSHVS
jgi:hypothetical protein